MIARPALAGTATKGEYRRPAIANIVGDMSLLGATSDGLKQHAADCSALAGELAAETVPTNAGLSCQLTAAAAQSLHAEVEAAGATLAVTLTGRPGLASSL